MDQILEHLDEVICKTRNYRSLRPAEQAVHNLADGYSAQQQALLLLKRAAACLRGAQRLFAPKED